MTPTMTSITPPFHRATFCGSTSCIDSPSDAVEDYSDPMHLRDALVLLNALAALVACGKTSDGEGSTGGGSNTPPTTAELNAFCDAQCSRSTRCGAEPVSGDAGVPTAEQCRTSCVSDLGVVGQHVREDILVALTECMETLSCDTNDDICSSQALESIGGDPNQAAQSPDVQACLSKHDACAGTSGSFTDDLCGTLLMLIDSQRTAAANCFERACEDLPACLGPIFGDY